MTTTKELKKSISPIERRKVLPSQRTAHIPDYLWKEAEKEMKLVKGRFRIYESNREGGTEKVTWRKYPPEICPMFEKVMKDGEIYEIPLYAARFINGFDSCAKNINGEIHSCSVGKHGFKMSHPNDLKPSQEGTSEAGACPVPVATVTKYERRMGFESLEFSGDLT